MKDNSKIVTDFTSRVPRTQVKKDAKTKKHYVYSIYDSDVTIVVRYTMTLTDKAVIDMPGNINYSQYGLNYVDNDDYEYEYKQPGDEGYVTPGKPDKPDDERDIDTATVYTYALAIQKVDELGKNLPGATFKVKGLTVTKKSDGYYYHQLNQWLKDDRQMQEKFLTDLRRERFSHGV